MTYAIQDLVIRHVSPFDSAEISELVARAAWDGPVARWLNSDPETRRRDAVGYVEIAVEHAVRYGEVYGTIDAATGRLTGVALWFPLTSPVPAPADYEHRLKDAAGVAFDRACALDAAKEAHHPLEPHHYLALAAVRPDAQDRGVGSALLDRHHSRLDVAGIPAYLEAYDLHARDLYLRHGYRVRSVIELPDGPLVWTMWRAPMP